MGLCIDGTVGCADNLTPRTLLGVDLKKMECPEQMLWASTPWLELVSNNELPDELNHSLVGPEELAKESDLCQRPEPDKMSGSLGPRR